MGTERTGGSSKFLGHIQLAAVLIDVGLMQVSMEDRNIMLMFRALMAKLRHDCRYFSTLALKENLIQSTVRCVFGVIPRDIFSRDLALNSATSVCRAFPPVGACTEMLNLVPSAALERKLYAKVDWLLTASPGHRVTATSRVDSSRESSMSLISEALSRNRSFPAVIINSLCARMINLLLNGLLQYIGGSMERARRQKGRVHLLSKRRCFYNHSAIEGSGI